MPMSLSAPIAVRAAVDMGARLRPSILVLILGSVLALGTFLLGPTPAFPSATASDTAGPTPASGGLSYSTYLGGAAEDLITGIAVDSGGDAFVVGWSGSPDFPTTAGAYNTTGSGPFAARLNATGGGLVYSTFLGGGGGVIAIDAAGDAYFAGYAGAGLPTTPGVFNPTGPGIYVMELNPSGTGAVYQTYVGAGYPRAIAVGGDGSVYVAGYADSVDFPATPSAADPTYNGGCDAFGRCSDAFVAKLGPGGTTLEYATFLGGAQGWDTAAGIAVDASGTAYVAGETISADFPTTPGASDRTCGSDGMCNHNGTSYYSDAFVTAVSPAGDRLAYSTFLGGGGYDGATSIAVQPSGSAFVAGGTSSTDFPSSAGRLSGGSDAFVAKLNPAGSSLMYAMVFGGSTSVQGYPDFDEAFGVAVDASGSAVVSGGTNAVDFPATPGSFDTAYELGWCGTGPDPCADAFVVRVDPAGSGITYGSYLGGDNEDWGAAIAVDPAGDVYVAGRTGSSDFPVTPGAFDVVNQGTTRFDRLEGFVAKFSPGSSNAYYEITVTTNISGLDVVVDGTRSGPVTFLCGVGSAHTIGAPSPQLVAGTPYEFVSWSDGGAQTHGIICDARVTYTARFQRQFLPDFLVSVSPSDGSALQGGSFLFTVTVTGTNGYSGPDIAISMVAPPQGIAGSCTPGLVHPNGTCGFNVNIAATIPPGPYALTFSGTNGSSGRTDLARLTVISSGDFRLTVAPASIEIVPGGTAGVSVTVTDAGGSPGPVALSISGLPLGIGASFQPAIVQPTAFAALTFVAAGNAAPGTYSVQIVGVGGGLQRSVTFELRVLSSQGPAPGVGWWPAALAIVVIAVAATGVALLWWSRRTRSGPREPPPEPGPPA